jgi:hypothetical protein
MTEERIDDGNEPQSTEPDEVETGPPWMRRRRRPLVRRVGGRVGGHVETRASYGILTLSTFGFEAAALLIIIAITGALAYLAQGRLLHALVFLLVGLLLAAVAFAVASARVSSACPSPATGSWNGRAMSSPGRSVSPVAPCWRRWCS